MISYYASELAVEAIINDLADRRGLRQEWEALDDDVRNEIRREWRELVRIALAGETL